MAESTHTYTRLPGKLRNELGIPKVGDNGSRNSQKRPGKRKEQRKAARLEKKTRQISGTRHIAARHPAAKVLTNEKEIVSAEQRHAKPASVQPHQPKSILKRPKTQSIPSSPRPSSQRIARNVREKIAEDDAEILALEKILGVKDKSKLPKSFEEDGLNELLEGLDNDENDSEAHLRKRRLLEEEVWLSSKRQKVQKVRGEAEIDLDEDDAEQENEDHDIYIPGKTQIDEESGEKIFSDSENEGGVFESLDEDDKSVANESEGLSSADPTTAARPARENPYVAPVSASTGLSSGKYVPPSLRNKEPGQKEDLSRLGKQIQGLLNRLSEANMLSIVADVEKLYLTNPRQHVSSTVLDVLLGLLSDPSLLQDTFIILHAGFIAALYKVLGTDFGAQAVQRIDDEFLKFYEMNDNGGTVDKRLVNLTSLYVELYNFHVISSIFVYDLIRLFLNKLSEINTELLLKIIRNAGTQLRQDDPSSLKAIVHSLQDQITKAGEDTVSIKIKFMMETMNSLKSNRLKTGVAASAVTSEHTIRMKKTLGTLNRKHVKASEPLRISLVDLRESERRGKWWLIGSSYKDDGKFDGQDTVIQEAKNSGDGLVHANDSSFEKDAVADLVQLAREQRMNTSVRQSIFVTIMSASDCNDAYLRLIGLRLKKSQELEIPKVLIHCSGAETVYNPFYTLLARKISSDRRLKMAFQFSLWDFFKEIDEGNAEPDGREKDGEENLGLRGMVNLARMFGSLIADGGLGLGVLKNLDFTQLQPKTKTFIEILLVTAILQSHLAANRARNAAVIIDMFVKPKEMFEMARGLHYFLKKTVSNSDVVGSESDKETVKWGCKVASGALKQLMSKTLYDV